ncbi:pectate lyase [Steroidobacter agaridevorans]|uniref:pectate lyase n=1 Tax=Steroidobacter agaridevorans TaxID=2695856 RepID=UPI0013793EA3|nr:pectate lyase [Steroidobacter agaridevorans]
MRALRYIAVLSLIGFCPLLVHAETVASVWGSAILRHERDWYSSTQARAIADSVLRYQSREGGWPKNTDLAVLPGSGADIPSDGRENTFDNEGTTLPMQFLARVIDATADDKYRQAFFRGLDYTLAAQYANGGWPQVYPLREGYYSHVTFNDNAMIRVLSLLRDVAGGKPPFAFVDEQRRRRAREALERGVDLILRTQIKQDGVLTAWCSQYDEHTLEPAWARRYEPPSLSGNESVGIIRFLMGIPHPEPEVIAAIEGGVRWLQISALRGIRVERFTNDKSEHDKRVVADADAGPLWARFYELGTNRPIFLGRDSVVHYTFAEIERERRTGYAYYGDWARELLDEEYPAWKGRTAAER